MPLPNFEIPKPSSLSLPKSLFLLTCASLAGSCTLLVISMLDLGYLSFWMNPSVSIFTIIYHIGVLLIARRQRDPNHPSYFSTAVFSAYLLATVWVLAFILTIAVVALGQIEEYKASHYRKEGLPCTVHTQRVQIVLALYEMLLVGGIALKGHSIVGSEGPDPHDWRNLEQGKANDPKEIVESRRINSCTG